MYLMLKIKLSNEEEMHLLVASRINAAQRRLDQIAHARIAV
ncbi:hypothetical protein C8N36_1195 [Pelagimonas varians]|uniref:Uncharacterized protein n=1 Tax=Pelagimonas varians TaxID=696760 RepID=A0A238L302_9RHOB|nr:hypothetical protein C8N36_1195 [Pelagimonas varians]SMX48812.1 hypothetical protein PEV8663_03960 [Pelagimonas varians]